MAIRKFHWSSVHDCVMHETDGLGNTLAEYTHEPFQYGPLISENRGGDEYVHHYDALGSTTMLTDETESVTDTFTYDAWGNEVARTGTIDSPYRWVGRWGYQFDESTESYYVRARVYQPTIARWTCVDPARFVLSDNQMDLYSYVQNRPSYGVDASGLIANFGVGFDLLAFTTLSCRTDDLNCPCDPGICLFVAFSSYTYTSNPDAIENFALTLWHVPGSRIDEDIRFPGRRVPTPNRCNSDMGRAAGGDIITFTLLTPRISCRYRQTDFPEPLPVDPAYWDNFGVGPCKGVFRPEPFMVAYPPTATGIRTRAIFGQRWWFRKPIYSVRMNFSIEVFCGCNGFDDLGRPLIRNSGSIHISKTINATSL